MKSETVFIKKFAEIVQRYRIKRCYSIENVAVEAELFNPIVNHLLSDQKRRITAYLMMKLLKTLNNSMSEMSKMM